MEEKKRELLLALLNEPQDNLTIMKLIYNDENDDVNVNIALGLSNYCPLHYASEVGNIQLIKQLIRQGADVNAKAKDEMTPLHVAARWGQLESIKLLLEHKADFNARNKDGKTAFMILKVSKHKNLMPEVEKLIQQAEKAKLAEMEKPTSLLSKLSSVFRLSRSKPSNSETEHFISKKNQ